MPVVLGRVVLGSGSARSLVAAKPVAHAQHYAARSLHCTKERVRPIEKIPCSYRILGCRRTRESTRRSRRASASPLSPRSREEGKSVHRSAAVTDAYGANSRRGLLLLPADARHRERWRHVVAIGEKNPSRSQATYAIGRLFFCLTSLPAARLWKLARSRNGQ